VDISSSDMLRVLSENARTVEDEYSDQTLAVLGSLPPAIDGVLFRNSPGQGGRV